MGSPWTGDQFSVHRHVVTLLVIAKCSNPTFDDNSLKLSSKSLRTPCYVNFRVKRMSPSHYPGYQRFFLRSFWCWLCLYCFAAHVQTTQDKPLVPRHCNLERLPLWPNSIDVDHHGVEFERTNMITKSKSKFDPPDVYVFRY